MFFQNDVDAVKRRWVAVATYGVAWATLACLPVATAAQETGARSALAQTDTLRLADAVVLALEANPSLQAARLRADAARERVPQVGALPDPNLSFGLMNRPLFGFGSSERMTMNTVQLTQRFPWPGKRGFAAARFGHLANALDLDAAEAERRLVSRVKSAYYELAFFDRALYVMEGTRELLRDFHEVSLAKYSVGEGLQQDVLQAQVAIARMTEDITAVQQRRLAMAARLNALLGRDATVSVPALQLFGPEGTSLTADSLMALAAIDRPALQAARTRIAAANAGIRAARRQVFPDLTVTLGYGNRPQYSDMATIMVGVSLPVWAGSKQFPLRRESQALHAEQEARERSLYNETYAQITESLALAVRATSLSDLYATSVLPQARAAVESALSAYRVGSVDFQTLLNNQLTVNRYEIETLQHAFDYQSAMAELEALVGVDFGGGQ